MCYVQFICCRKVYSLPNRKENTTSFFLITKLIEKTGSSYSNGNNYIKFMLKGINSGGTKNVPNSEISLPTLNFDTISSFLIIYT